MKKLFLFFFFLCFVNVVSATTIFSDNFNYADKFIEHGWVSTKSGATCTPFSDYPIEMPPSVTSFGINSNLNCNHALEYNLSSNFTSGILTLSAVYYYNSNTTSTHNYDGISFQSAYNQLTVYGRLVDATTNFQVWGDVAVCNVNISNYASFANDSTKYAMEWNLNASTISLYIDDGTTNCSNIPITPNNGKNVVGVRMDLNFAVGAVNGYASFDNIELNDGVAVTQICSYPMLFCDNFDYSYPMVLKGWQPQSLGGSINSTFTPTNSKLVMNGSNQFSLFHKTPDLFETHYYQNQIMTISASSNSPIFSSEFQLTLSNTSDITEIGYCPRYMGLSTSNGIVFDIAFCAFNNTVYYRNSTGNSDYLQLCTGCINPYSTYNIKTVSKFSQRGNYDFNSSFASDSVDVVIGNTLYTVPHFADAKDGTNLQQYFFLESENLNISIDNYYVMVGTDKYIDTSYNYLTQLFTPTNITSTPTGQGQDDFYNAVSSIWEQFGLKSLASKILFGLLLMFITAIGYVLFWISITQAHPPSVMILGIIEILEVLILVYVGLIPVWILLTLIILLIVIAIVLLMFRRGS